MFSKPDSVRIGTRSLLRAKEVRVILDGVALQLPTTAGNAAALDALLSKAATEETKLASKCILYGDAHTHVPTLINVVGGKGGGKSSGIGRLIPTVFGLWTGPLLPIITVSSPVSSFLINGADLMLPGVLEPLPRFDTGTLVAIAVDGNPAPFAVGEALLSDAAARTSGMRGRGVAILHAYRDHLWELGGRAVPNSGFLPTQVVAVREREPVETQPVENSAIPSAAVPGDAAAAATMGQPLSAPAAAPAPVGISSGHSAALLSPDDLLRATFLQALKRHVTSKDLPMLSSKLFGVAMVAAKPAGAVLDVRKTTWKKTSAFLMAMCAEGIVTAEVDAKQGTHTLTAVNREHIALKRFKPWPEGGADTSAAADSKDAGPIHSSSSSSSSSSTAAPPPLQIDEYFRAPPAALKIFEWVGANALAAGRRPLGRILKDPRGRSGRRTALVVVGSASNAASTPAVAVSIGAVAAAGAGSSTSCRAPAPSPAALLKGKESSPPAADARRASDNDDGTGDDLYDAADENDDDDGDDGETEEGHSTTRNTLPPAWLHLVTRIGKMPVLYTASEYKEILQQYLALQMLVLPSDKRRVTLDLWLADAIAGSQQQKQQLQHAPVLSSREQFPALGSRTPASTASTTAASTTTAPAATPASANLSKILNELGLPAPSPAVHNPAASLSREDVARLWLDRGSRHRMHTVSNAVVPGEVVVYRGPPPPITLSVRALQGGRKHTTHVNGFAHFGISPEPLAKEAAKKFAASATVQPCALNPSITEIMLQGDVADALARAIAGWYGIPIGLITVV